MLEGAAMIRYQCPRCRRTVLSGNLHPSCGNCGSRMDLAGENELPGFEGSRAAAGEAAGEAQAARLSELLRTPKADISAKAGEMERNSPLFHGTGDNPGLF